VKCLQEATATHWVSRFVVRGDRFKLNQVLRNFLSNALKFCRRDDGEVSVLVQHFEKKAHLIRRIGSHGPSVASVRDFVRVSVVDNGCGISKANQQRLFGQYVQFNAGALQKGGGSGLGLWIAKSE
jgi:signal transduction histidine kinase